MAYLLNTPFSLTYEVTKILKRKEDGYTYTEIKATKYDKDYDYTKFKIMKLRGFFPVIFVGDTFNGTVVMRESRRHGYFLEVVGNPVYELPHTKKAIISLLKKRINNIKISEAEELVAVGGKKTITKLVNDTQEFYGQTSLSNTRINNIKKKLEGDVFFEDLMLFMQTLKIGALSANYIYQQFGMNSIAKIKRNPYCICQINEISFQDADMISERLGLKINDYRRIKSGILEYLYYREKNNGDLCVYKKDLMESLEDFLNIHGGFSQEVERIELEKEEIYAAYNRLIEKEKIVEKLNSNNEEIVYLSHLYKAESSIVQSVLTMIHTPSSLLAESDVDDYINSHSGNAKRQNEAIRNTFKHRCSILTGGPGTGKTFTVNQIVECLKTYKPEATVRLLAPTGRASSKLTEVTGLPSSTIHKAINVRPTASNSHYYQEKQKEVKLLEDDLVIVDESSMNDVIIFSMLLEAVSIDTTLLIVGDDNQLSPVGPGLVLRDMIESQIVPVTCLNEIFRQAQDSQIVSNAHKLKAGKTTKDEDGITFDASKGDFYFIQRETMESIADTVVQMTLRTIKNKNISIWDILLLSPIKNDIAGVYNLNRMLQARINPPADFKEEYVVNGLMTLREGDKVINIQNDKDLNVNNGDIGKIIEIEVDGITGEPMIHVEYNYGTRVYDYENIKYLELAYCITVHKSQGTEADVIIMPISPAHKFNLNKRLVYTAWTRAKKMVICVGDLRTLDEVILKDEAPRNSCLKERFIEIKK